MCVWGGGGPAIVVAGGHDGGEAPEGNANDTSIPITFSNAL